MFIASMSMRVLSSVGAKCKGQNISLLTELKR